MRRNGPVFHAVGQTIRMHKGLSCLLILSVACSIVAGVVPPLILEQVIDRLADGGGCSLAMVFIYFAVLSAAGFLNAGKESLITVFGQKVTHQLRSSMCQKLTVLPSSYFTRQETGATVSRFVGDVDTVETLFTSGVISMVADAFEMISILLIIFIKSPGLGILLLLTLPFLYVLTRMFQKRMKQAQLENRKAVGRAAGHVPDTIRSIRMIHNLKKERFMEERYDRCIEESFSAVSRANFYDAVYSPIILTVSAALVAVMMILSARGGFWMQLFGMSVGTAVAVISYVGKIFGPLESIGMEIQNIQAAAAGISRIGELLAEPETIRNQQSGNVVRIETPAVRMDKVCFGYDRPNEVLHEFNLTVQPGEQVTLIGRTGAGKSTVFRLMLGLYEPWSGTIMIGGRNAAQIPQEERRMLFGYVEQTFLPVPGTIADQITLGDARITQQQIWDALALVGMSDVVGALPDGLLTVYQAEMFSQGQIQLLSIARAVVSEPQILLLDEITANLDSDTQQRVIDALLAAAKDRTVLSISHRLYECSGGRMVEL